MPILGVVQVPVQDGAKGFPMLLGKSMTFLDKMRDTPETWTEESYGGFDPDLHCSGLAVVYINKSNHSRFRVLACHLVTITIAKTFKNQQAVVEMVRAIQAIPHHFHVQHGLVESQKIYYKEADHRSKIVGVGNDLIKLAAISGAALSLYMDEGAGVTLSLPEEWKRQAHKEAQHDALIRLLMEHGSHVTFNGTMTNPADLTKQPTHALDAACMALKGAGHAVT
jgi:hypothetical protein